MAYSSAQFMSDEARAYYDGGKRVIVDGAPCRKPAWFRSRIGGKEAIKAMVAANEGIDVGQLSDAPSFRFVPGKVDEKLPDYAKPTGRGTIKCGNGARPFKSDWGWRPARLSLDPQYSIAMTGDNKALTEARSAWANGNPKPLRAYLATSSKDRAANWARIDCANAVAAFAKAFGQPLSFDGRREAAQVKGREALFAAIDVGRSIAAFAVEVAAAPVKLVPVKPVAPVDGTVEFDHADIMSATPSATEKTYTLVMHKPGSVRRLGNEIVTIDAGEQVVGTGKSFAEATSWARRSPRLRTIREDAEPPNLMLDSAKPATIEAATFKAIRLSLGLTQPELGERLGYTEMQIRRFESGSNIPKPVAVLMNMAALYRNGLNNDALTVLSEAFWLS